MFILWKAWESLKPSTGSEGSAKTGGMCSMIWALLASHVLSYRNDVTDILTREN